MTNAILTFVLGVLAVAGVIFALQAIFLTREFRQLTAQAAFDKACLEQANAIANDVEAYNQKTPDPQLKKILEAANVRPVAH